MTPSGHKADRNPAVQRSPGAPRRAIVEWQHRSAVALASIQNDFQVCPKDLPAILRKVGGAETDRTGRSA